MIFYKVKLFFLHSPIHLQDKTYSAEKQKLIFDASMMFQLDAITLPSQQHRYAVYHVFEPIKMLLSIYVQAFKLWRKKVPFYRHPQINKDR